MRKKAQATLEFALMAVVAFFLLLGILYLWKWSSDNIVKRQVEYNQTRLSAGKKSAVPSEGVPVLIKCQGASCTPVVPGP